MNSRPCVTDKIFSIEMINPNTSPTWIMYSDYHCLVRVARLERAASTSQMWRPTNWATPGYLVVMIIARNSCDSKFFPVCGHLCGQRQFLAQFADPSKSRKRPCFKGFRTLAVPIVDRKAYAPKAGALPTALHPVIELFYPAGRIHPNHPRCVLRCTRK